ncbi:hypothetical protein [Bacillus paramycoides]|uniref:hypothetical protein n=1 Tax=Bacillus paramycoides TaxID=2026194 RepID=UPI002E1BC95F|nr:hypothetical protein [Bacillus paramycoides]
MALSQLINEEKYGSGARHANEIIERLTTLDWYVNAGQQNLEAEKKVDRFMSSLNISEYEIRWISRKQLNETIGRLSFEDSTFWEALKEVPDQLKEKIVRTGNEKLLADVVDKVPEAIFHGAYKQVLNIFGDEKAVKFLVGHAMYISVLACATELAEENNLFLPIVELLEGGHLPLGPEGDTFYLL